jgi:hypothetical protein
MCCLVVAAVSCAASAGVARTSSEASLLGVGDSVGDQLTGYTVGQLRQGRSSSGLSGWCEWWCRRRRRLPADAVGDSSKGPPDSHGNVGELRSDRCRDILSIGPSFSVILILRTNARTYRTFIFASTLISCGGSAPFDDQPVRWQRPARSVTAVGGMVQGLVCLSGVGHDVRTTLLNAAFVLKGARDARTRPPPDQPACCERKNELLTPVPLPDTRTGIV